MLTRFTKNTSQSYILNILEQYGNYTIEVEGETINLNGKNTQVKIILPIKFVDLDFEKQFRYLNFNYSQFNGKSTGKKNVPKFYSTTSCKALKDVFFFTSSKYLVEALGRKLS